MSCLFTMNDHNRINSYISRSLIWSIYLGNATLAAGCPDTGVEALECLRNASLGMTEHSLSCATALPNDQSTSWSLRCAGISNQSRPGRKVCTCRLRTGDDSSRPSRSSDQIGEFFNCGLCRRPLFKRWEDVHKWDPYDHHDRTTTDRRSSETMAQSGEFANHVSNQNPFAVSAY